MRMVRVVLWMGYCAALAGQPEQAVFPIAGTAVDADSGRPMRRVRIVLAPSAQPLSEIASQVTAGDGSFHFDAPEGKYQLRAERNGLPPQSYGSVSLRVGFGIAVVTGPGQITNHLEFRIYPPAAIGGKITDETGDPVENALVQPVRFAVYAGRKSSAIFASRYTNDLGEYRFGNLPSGTYYLAATGKPWYAEQASRRIVQGVETAPNPFMTAFAPAFYPNTSDARAAAAIGLKSGQEMTANLTLRTAAGYDINIRYEGTSVPARGVRLQLLAEGPQGSALYSRVLTSYGGGWSIPSVTPGRYVIRASGQSDMLVGSKSIEVTSANLDVQMELVTTSVTGTVELDNGDKRLLRKLVVTLHDESAKIAVPRSVKEDGTFNFPSITPGRYRLHVAGQKGVHVKAVTASDAVVKDGIVEIGPEGVHKLAIVAGTRAGRVKGFVYRRSVPASGVLVLLAKSNGSADHLDYHGFMTDSDGSFDFQGVPIGEYELFALEDVDFEYSNPAVVAPLIGHGRRLRVEFNGTSEERLELP